MLKKQGNHNSKPNITFTKKPKRKVHKHTINGNHPTQTKQQKRNKGDTEQQLKNTGKVAINTSFSRITLNANGLNTLINRHRVSDWIKSKNVQAAVYNDSLQSNDLKQIDMREWEKIFHVNGQERKTGVVLTMANKVDFLCGRPQRKIQKDAISGRQDGGRVLGHTCPFHHHNTNKHNYT